MENLCGGMRSMNLLTLPKDEFDAEKTGAATIRERIRQGLLEPLEAEELT